MSQPHSGIGIATAPNLRFPELSTDLSTTVETKGSTLCSDRPNTPGRGPCPLFSSFPRV
jgi:hypothetical protein